jgi:hypothetical protein
VKKGGGVVYFPPGDYSFTDHVKIKSGIVIRGATPAGVTDARDEKYDPPTRFAFPKYKAVCEDHGTKVETAFKGVYLDDPLATTGAGLVNVALNRAHVFLGPEQDFSANFQAGKGARNLIVYGCVLRNAAVPDPKIPMVKVEGLEEAFQEPWQRWTHRHHAAITIFALAHALVANNRIPASGEDNFVMKDYRLFNRTGEAEGIKNVKKLKVLRADVTFDYDNRPGISANHLGLFRGLSVWDPYAEGAQPPPKDLKPPAPGLAQGLVIRQNYVYCTGCTAIRATGDGTVIAQNIMRFKPKAVLVTARGYQFDHFTNNNRAVEIRAWRWTLEGNDYEVYSNLTPEGGKYGDGEGMMHEAYDGCPVVDSKALNNKGNAYICVWRVPVDGLLVQGNQVNSVRALCWTNKRINLPAKNIQIIGNTTSGGGIELSGGGAENCLIKDNKQTGPNGKLINTAGAKLENNTGYEEPK